MNRQYPKNFTLKIALGERQLKQILRFSPSESDPEVFYYVLCNISQNDETSSVKFHG